MTQFLMSSFSLQLFRHGDRSPVEAYPTDPYQEKDWPQGFGQLSQSYLCAALKILVRSTDYDRTLMSAEANLAGLYPPSGQQIFTPSLKWQPIPVHTVPQSEERVSTRWKEFNQVSLLKVSQFSLTELPVSFSASLVSFERLSSLRTTDE
uniref:Lysosomal acid phosphatase n=1 Tax=Acanthochromis polyacanthus TaxID=80966 RepID=A0A3Q1G0N7_9TELE